MEKEWYSWEYLLREDIRRLNHRFLKAQEAMARFGRWNEVHDFALSRLKQIIIEECEKGDR